MTIASEIARLQGVKSDILGAIAEKKVDVPTGAMLADAPDLIRSIKSGINVKIGQGVYPAVKIGNQLWLARNLDEELGTLGVDEWYYNGRSQKTNVTYYSQNIPAQGYHYTQFRDWEKGSIDSIYVPPVRKLFFHSVFKHTGTSSVNAYVRLVGRDDNGATQVQAITSSISVPPNTATVLEGGIELVERIKKVWRVDIVYGVNNLAGVAVTEIRMNFDTADCGANAINVYQALANEATAKANGYGRLYTWNNVNKNISKLGLTKWRWPTKADFDALVALDPTGKKFRIPSFGYGSNEFGFSAVASGRYTGTFNSIGNNFESWGNENGAVTRLRIILSAMDTDLNGGRTDGRSLRLVMDLNDDGTIPDSNIVIEEPATTAEPLALASEPIVDEEDK